MQLFRRYTYAVVYHGQCKHFICTFQHKPNLAPVRIVPDAVLNKVMQRAIGMSAASLYKTFLWEGAYYGIFASVIGAVLGYVCCIFVGAAQTDTLQLVAVPVAAILEAAAVSVAACLAATAIPLRTISRMSIVDSIETGE